jgi:hypothetical protein
MNVLRQIAPEAATGVTIVTTPEGLRRFRDPDCAAAIWHRRPAPGFQGWLDGLDPAQLPNGRCVLHRTQLRTAATELCAIAETPQGAERDSLIDDVAALSEMFADLMNAGYLRLRLQAVTTNACRKFHVDAITGRLVCTYRGTGTQYGISGDGGDPAQVFTTPTGAPILLRGTLWPERPASGLLHRSPPIEGTGETRLVLVLDPVFDPEEAV